MISNLKPSVPYFFYGPTKFSQSIAISNKLAYHTTELNHLLPTVIRTNLTNTVRFAGFALYEAGTQNDPRRDSTL